MRACGRDGGLCPSGVAGWHGEAIERGRTFEHRNDTPHRVGERLEVISAFDRCYKATAATLVGNGHDEGRQSCKLIARQAHPAQRIIPMRVESHRDEQQFGFELSKDVGRDLVDSLIVGVGGSSLDRKVDVEACARSGTGFIGCASTRIERVLVG